MWLTKNIRYGADLGYVMLQIPAISLPNFTYETIEYEAKEELHCSLLCTKKLAEFFSDPEQAEVNIFDFVKQYVETNGHTLGFESFTQHAYLCEEGDVKSIVIGAKVRGIDQLFAALRTHFKQLANVASPALHVTLYKYNHRFGIGIQNEAQLKELCRPLPLNVLPKAIKEML
jgi:hypothetical protein